MSFWRMAAKQSPPKSRMRSGKRGVEGRELQVAAGRRRSACWQSARPEQAVEQRTRPPARRSSSSTMKAQQILGHRRHSTFRRMTVPRRRRFSARLEQAHQILGLFLDLDVAVADHAEIAERRRRRSRGTARSRYMPISASSGRKRIALPGRRTKRVDLRGQRQQRAQLAIVVGAAQLQRDRRSRGWG